MGRYDLFHKYISCAFSITGILTLFGYYEIMKSFQKSKVSRIISTHYYSIVLHPKVLYETGFTYTGFL